MNIRFVGIFLIIVGILMLSGCSKYKILSNPPGAKILHSGNNNIYHDSNRTTPGILNSVAHGPFVKVQWADGIISKPKTMTGNKTILFNKNTDIIKNRVVVTINSEPPGSRVYENGKLLGVTPIEGASFTLDKNHYDANVIIGNELIFVKEGFLPKKLRPKVNVDPSWRNYTNREFEKHFLVILDRDPSAPLIGVGGSYSSINSNSKSQACSQANSDYNQAEATYERAKSIRDSRRNESAMASLGAMSNSSVSVFNRWISNSASGSANTAQQDMNHALQMMQGAKSRVSIHCGY